jgi:hypothetical protein
MLKKRKFLCYWMCAEWRLRLRQLIIQMPGPQWLLPRLTPCLLAPLLQGYLTSSDLYTFFKEVHTMWVAMGEYADLSIHDVLDEIMDMVQPATHGTIRPADLAGSKMAGTVISILANVDQFYQYNYR